MYFLNYFQTLSSDSLKSYARRSRSSQNNFPAALHFISSEYLFVIDNRFLKMSAMFMVSFFILVCSIISLFSCTFWTIFVDSLSEFLIFFIGYQSFFGTAFLKNRVSAFFLSICFLSFFLSFNLLSFNLSLPFKLSWFCSIFDDLRSPNIFIVNFNLQFRRKSSCKL